MQGETMNRDEYNILFHKLELNLVAFKRLMDCDEEVLKLVNAAIEAEREACAALCDELVLEHPGRADLTAKQCAFAIRERGAP
jgi:hypothetical protein